VQRGQPELGGGVNTAGGATVKAHISHILTKLDLDNRTQIALLAHDAGLG